MFKILFSEIYENEVNNNSSIQKPFLRITLYIASSCPEVIYCNEITIKMENEKFSAPSYNSDLNFTAIYM